MLSSLFNILFFLLKHSPQDKVAREEFMYAVWSQVQCFYFSKNSVFNMETFCNRLHINHTDQKSLSLLLLECTLLGVKISYLNMWRREKSGTWAKMQIFMWKYNAKRSHLTHTELMVLLDCFCTSKKNIKMKNIFYSSNELLSWVAGKMTVKVASIWHARELQKMVSSIWYMLSVKRNFYCAADWWEL